MDIQAEKIELIKLIADVDNEKVLKKIRSFLKTEEKDQTVTPAMSKRLEESRQQLEDGKGIKIAIDDLWK